LIFSKKKFFSLFILDTDNNKNLNSDLSSTENSNSQLSRILQPTAKPIDVRRRKKQGKYI
jgi:hypothetical protein